MGLRDPLALHSACRDRSRKLRIYARESVGHVWLVSVEARTLEVLRRQGDEWLLAAVHEGAARVRAEPFEAVELDLAALWGETAIT